MLRISRNQITIRIIPHIKEKDTFLKFIKVTVDETNPTKKKKNK